MNRLQSLYKRYQTELRPLIIDYESREEEFLESILDDVPFMFDNAARYTQEGTPELLKEAETSLDVMLRNVRSEVLYSYLKSDNKYRRRYDEDVRNAINGGEFSRKYNKLRNDAVMATEAGNTAEAIRIFKQIEQLRNQHQPTAMSVGNLRQGFIGFIVELIVSIIISIVIGIVIAKTL